MSQMLKLKKLCFAALIIGCSGCSSRTASAQLAVGEAEGFAWRVEPSYRYRKDGQAGRAVSIRLKDTAYHGAVSVTVMYNRVSETTLFQTSDTLYRSGLLLPAGAGVDSAAKAELFVSYSNKTYTATIPVPRMKQWTVYIYPHSHLDIGYTALPEDVKKLQARNIDVGMDLAEKTQHYPEGARFVWNPEATWIVSNYLRDATTEKKKRFAEAVKKGWIQIDAGHSNINTSTCSDEELLQYFNNSKSIEQLTGVPTRTMVQMDVPGAAWGLVAAAAQYGVHGMISFPNNYDTRKAWENKPFYWVAPDGKTKMLFLQGFPYGIGYTIKGNKYGLAKLQTYSDTYDRVQTQTPSVNFLDPFIFEETAKPDMQQSPYDLFAMTWSMADNCVIDADLPEAVKAWNEKYAYPHLVISGSKTILDAYEKKYGAVIPEYRGDFTEFWTNGLGADAASVGAGRKGKEALIQAETVWSMLQPAKMPQQQFDSAWENCLLSAEHTWGAQNSNSLLARQVEKIKASYFTGAGGQSAALIHEALRPYRDTMARGFCVINTLSWNRTGLVTLTKAQTAGVDRLLDDQQQPVLSQRLSNGELIFLARDIPALGSRYYTIRPGLPGTIAAMAIAPTGMQSDSLVLELDTASGNISSIKSRADGYEYVNAAAGINSYSYVSGVYNGQDQPKPALTVENVSFSIKEKGPLLVSLLVRSKAPGVQYFDREIRLYNHSRTVEIENTLSKIPTRNKESIHIGFSFAIPGGVSRMEMPWSIVMPNTDQLPGANKNWFAFQRWADVSNTGHGVTWSAIESPLIEWGELSGNILDGARQHWLWKKELAASSTLYSFILNNHWDTNFPLEQGGIIKESYSMQFHNGYDAVAASRFGLEAHRPLLVVQAKKNIIEKPIVHIDNPAIMLSVLKKTEGSHTMLLRVKSVSSSAEPLQLSWPSAKPREIIVCNAAEEPIGKMRDNFQVTPFGMATLKLVF